MNVILWQWLGSYATAMALGVLFQIPAAALPLAGLSATVGAICYTLLGGILDQNGRVLVATLAVAVLSHVLARLRKTPVTLYLIPGIVPLVPGTGVYRIAYSMIYESPAMVGEHLFETLKIAGTIALGVFLVDTLFRRSIRAIKAIRQGGSPED